MVLFYPTILHVIGILKIILLCKWSASTIITKASTNSSIMERYKPISNQIIDYLLNGPGKGQALERLTVLTDTFGHRMVGEDSLEKSIDYLIEQMSREKLDNVHKEVVENLPRWVRGYDTVTLMSPRHQKLAVLALGGTVPTPQGGICGTALVVKSFDEMETMSDQVKGRIVVYNQEWQGYGASAAYRTRGASRAAHLGAVAVLVRSVTPHSSYTPHTGSIFYKPAVPKIPAASLTVEDAEMLHRMQKRGHVIKICMNITSQTVGKVDSHNTVVEITGSEYPEEIVMIGGHLDSWDVGVGAMDDGGGVVASWQALSTIKALGLKPKRTIRAVFWTAEEQGYLGCAAYYQKHKNDGSNNETYRFVYESDAGAFKPDGLTFTGPPGSDRWKKMEQVLKLLAPINATKLYWLPDNFAAGDVEPWRHNDNVPAAILDTPSTNDYYFTYHHTEADRVNVFNADDLNYVSALTAVVAFVVADLPEPF